MDHENRGINILDDPRRALDVTAGVHLSSPDVCRRLADHDVGPHARDRLALRIRIRAHDRRQAHLPSTLHRLIEYRERERMLCVIQHDGSRSRIAQGIRKDVPHPPALDDGIHVLSRDDEATGVLGHHAHIDVLRCEDHIDPELLGQFIRQASQREGIGTSQICLRVDDEEGRSNHRLPRHNVSPLRSAHIFIYMRKVADTQIVTCQGR